MDVTYLLLAGLAFLVLLPAAVLLGPGFAGRKRGPQPRYKGGTAADNIPRPPAASGRGAAAPKPEVEIPAGAAPRALFSEGLYRETLAALYKLPRPDWSEEDCALALRACLRLNDFQRARNVFGWAQGEPGLRESPLLQYLFAIACERAGDAKRATALYDKLLRLKGGYQDCEARLRRLRRLPAEDARTMSAFFETTRGRRSRAQTEAASRSLALPGEVGGRFGALGLLGVGGSGIVFLARDKASGRLVALKRLGHEMARDPEARARFLEEAGTLAELRHPRIVEFYEALEHEGNVYLVLEYVDWDTLQTVLALRGKLTPAEVVPILSAVAEALDFAHKKKIIHRDLKPGNIVAGPKGFVKVMDFGIARHFEPGAADSQEVEVIGTPPYMAPEQHAGITTPLSDIYSFGVTAYVLLTGRLPFAGPDALYYSQKLERDYPRLPAGLPAGLSELIDRCLMFEPEKRPVDAAALIGQLSGVRQPGA